MVDAGQGDTLYRWNAGKYFTPASNMKLFTLYAGLKTLPDHIPALKYQVRSDTLLVLGTGDPSALHPVLMDSS
ncbi:MAG: D-alanyl-D-alanine carboxypeptidase, partial [Bacteroidetes bacterium]